MSLFQTPPPVSASNSSATPPIPHAPIGTQGDPPPRRQVAAALMMVAVLASWPSDLEPRLTGPNNTRTKIAPLTLPTGQQPPNVGPITPTELRLIVSAWPTDSPPILRSPINAAVLPAPPVTTYTPPGRFPEAIGRAWLSPDPAPVQRVESVVPTFAAVSQPPVRGSQPPLVAIVAAWTPAPIIPPPLQPTAAWNVPPVVQTFVPCARFPDAIGASWQPSDQVPPPRLRSVVPTFAAVSQPQPQAALSVLELAQIVASWPIDVGPILPWPLSTPTKIAPLTLPTGTAPQPQSPLSVTELAQIVSTWTQTWDAQTAPKNAGWNVPPVLISLPHTPLPASIWTTWEPPFVAPPRPVAIVTLTLPTGTQPPMARAALERPVAAAVAWQPDPPAPPPLRPTAGWNVPPVLTQPAYTTPPLAIRAAWEEPFRLPQRLTTVATVTLRSGDAPPPRSSHPVVQMAVVATAWQPPFVVPPQPVPMGQGSGEPLWSNIPSVIVTVRGSAVIITVRTS